jgi:Domain of unknown function (DUF4337)
MSTANNPTPEAPAEKPVKKGPWETVLTMTPVILTVIATLLAGLSSGEMTKAMYHRSMAGQNQSKVGDQWAFFQAKRIRGTNMETEVDLLPAVTKVGPLKPVMLHAAAARLTRTLNEARAKVEALQKAAKEAGEEQLANQAEALLKKKPDDLLKNVDVALEKNEGVFVYLGTDKLPEPEKLSAEAEEYKKAFKDQSAKGEKAKEGPPQIENLKAALKALTEFKSETEVAALVRKVDAQALAEAIHGAEVYAKHNDDASKVPGGQIRALNTALSQLTLQAALIYQLSIAAEGSKPGESTPPRALKEAMEGLDKASVAAGKAADDLTKLFLTAQSDYTARRYRSEAGYNLDTALLYEVQVHRSSANSDAHIKRSGFFFFGMLGAQCGVAIASISLAARQKSLLWVLAALAGVGAMAFSAYVYLSV